MATIELLQAIAVTAELTGTQLSNTAARVMADDLSQYPEQQVLRSLVRCRKELRGHLTIADVVARLDDGRPNAEEAWAIVFPALNNEAVTVIWTEGEMNEAFGVALNLADDPVAARMAFKETYNALVSRARDEGKPVKWIQCLGHDAAGRDGPLLKAVAEGKLLPEYAKQFLSGPAPAEEMQRLIAGAIKTPQLESR